MCSSGSLSAQQERSGSQAPRAEGQNVATFAANETGNPVDAQGWVTAAAPLERIPVYLREGGSLTDLRASA
jgi:hypothetical protein